MSNRMLSPRRAWLGAVALAAAPALAAAQQAPVPARPELLGPPVQPIATASAVSRERLGIVLGVRELPDGRVLVNDGGLRRLLLMDTTMKTVGIVLDSAAAVANAYGTRGALLPFRGDSTLFLDPASYAMLVIDPAGRVVRVRSVWRVQDVPWVSNMMGNASSPGVDARGRIVYRIPARPAPPSVPPPAGIPYIPQDPDSAFVVAVDVDSRKVDTLAVVRVPVSGMSVRKNPDGMFVFEQMTNPLPITDEWAVLSDGTVALLRERDYRIEYHNPDGTVTSSGKLPYPWQRLTDDDKQHIVDSVVVAQKRAAANNYISSLVRWVNQFGRSYPAGLKLPDGYALPPGLPKEWKLPAGVKVPDNYIYACPPGVDPMPGMMMGGQSAMAAGFAAGAAAAQGGRVTVNTTVAAGTPPAGGPVTLSAPGAPTPSGATVAVSTAGAPTTAAPATPPAAPGAPAAASPANPQALAAAASALGLRCLPAPMSFGSGGFRPPPPTMPGVHVVPASELPDYRPPIAAGSVRADMDGNLWIRTLARPVPGGPVFDIVNRAGALVSRLQIPVGYTVAGFGRGKVVYLSMRDAAGLHLARVRLR